MATSISTLKSWFTTGKFPTQAQFWAWLDSYRHKDESIPVNEIEGLNELLDLKADAELISNHTNDIDAHADLFVTKVDKVPGKGLSTNDYTTEEKEKLAALDGNVTLLDANGDANFTKQVVAKPDGTLGVEDKYGVTTAWTNITLAAGVTIASGGVARYRNKGNTVEVDIRSIQLNGVYADFASIPQSLAPTGGVPAVFFHGYNVSNGSSIMVSLKSNGKLSGISATGAQSLTFNFQWDIL